MDEIDMAQERDEIGLADAIRVASTSAPVAVATGRCLWCDEILNDTQRWCPDTDCRELWERERRLRAGGRQ